ncbi:MAG: AAA family ATPase [Defluviitaleaceae bacterium]|nr:AAA family ATPase [Defluviitaleaceae bacterium]
MTVKYFTDAHSAVGYVNLQNENLMGILHIFHLKSPTEQGVHNVLEQLACALLSRQLKPEYIYAILNPDLLAGIVIRELSTAFTSGKSIITDAKVIDLAPLYDKSTIKEKQDDLAELELIVDPFYQKMTMHFNAALHIRHEWGNIYRDRMHVDQAHQFQAQFITRLFETKIPPHSEGPRLLKRFSDTYTLDGACDFIPELTTGLKRYLIKGPPGSGKSTLIKAIANQAMTKGYDVDLYPSSFDPNTLNMVIVPELSFCLLNATEPDNQVPSFLTDEVVDTDAFIKTGTNQRCAFILEEIESKYTKQMTLALTAMKNAHTYKKALNDIYDDALMPEQFMIISDQLMDRLS